MDEIEWEKQLAPPALTPEKSLLVRLAALVVHVDVLFRSGIRVANIHDPDEADLRAIAEVLNDPEVVEWRKQMAALALLPVKT